MSGKKIPRPPNGLRLRGRALWRAVVREFELDEHETVVLREACRTADSLDALQALLDEEGPMSSTSQGPRVHPALPELRQQRIALARMIAVLRIPAGVEDDGRIGPRALRGVYRLGGVS